MPDKPTMTDLTKRVIDASVLHAAGASEAIAEGFATFGGRLRESRHDPAGGFINGMIQAWGAAINKYADTLDKVSEALRVAGSPRGNGPQSGEPQDKETRYGGSF